MPRVVRLGRPANDNARRPTVPVRVLATVIATALTVVLYRWWLS